MDKETVEIFLNKFVQICKISENKNKTFNLYGTIKKVTDQSVLIETDRLGAILLDDIISIREAERKQDER